jgi:hypothetical protein
LHDMALTTARREGAEAMRERAAREMDAAVSAHHPVWTEKFHDDYGDEVEIGPGYVLDRMPCIIRALPITSVAGVSNQQEYGPEMVEELARAARDAWRARNSLMPETLEWSDVEDEDRVSWLDGARDHLRTLRSMGVLAMPDEVAAPLPPMVSETDAPKCMSKADAIAWVVGWNGCREAMLAAAPRSDTEDEA